MSQVIIPCQETLLKCRQPGRGRYIDAWVIEITAWIRRKAGFVMIVARSPGAQENSPHSAAVRPVH